MIKGAFLVTVPNKGPLVIMFRKSNKILNEKLKKERNDKLRERELKYVFEE